MTNYTNFIDIPASANKDIETLIMNDEGGYILTSNADDPDGGWTYAGVTARNYQIYFGTFPSTPKDYKLWFLSLPEFRRKEIAHEIYFAEFWKPLAEVNLGAIFDYELSCAVNCGLQTVETINKNWGTSVGYGKETFKSFFLREWMKHYIVLVQDNAQDWREYGLALAVFGSKSLQSPRPATLRATNLLGWFNRVEKYRSGNS